MTDTRIEGGLQRECDCTPQIERCVHFSERRLVLADSSRGLCPLHSGIEVAVLSNVKHVAFDCGCPTMTGDVEKHGYYWGYDREQSLAAFHEAEQALLRGEA